MNLIFLHYFGGGPRSWNGVIERLDNFPAQTPDLREVGRLAQGYSVGRAATDVMQLVGEQSSPFVLVGHSMGGKIALAIAATQPENLRGLFLIAPSPPSPEPMGDAMRASMLDGHGTREAAERIIEGAAGGPLAPEVWQTAIAANLAYSDRDWRNWIEIGTREDITTLVPGIKVPVFIIAGEHDDGMSASFLRGAIAAQIPGTSVEEVAGIGHLVPQGKPDETARLIENWVNGLE